MQPDLDSVGFDGWAKGGDTNDYGAGMVVSPKAKLGIVVLTAGASSLTAFGIAERFLLGALAENGAIATVPPALAVVAPPVAPVPTGLLASIGGAYAQGGLVVDVEPQPDDSLQAYLVTDTGRVPSGAALRYREDGWFASDADPLRAFKVVDTELLGQPARYFVTRGTAAGYGNYLDTTVFGQRVEKKPAGLSAAWQQRLGATWLVVNAHPDELAYSPMDPRLRLSEVPGLTGLLAIRGPVDPAPPAGQPDTRTRLVDPSASDTTAAMMLVIPQATGRDLDDLVIETRAGAEWARFGSYLHQPIAQVPVLASGTTSVTIGAEGFSEWRAVTQGATPVTITISGADAWQLYDAAFAGVAHGDGSAAPALPAGAGRGYLAIVGAPGRTITLSTE